MQIFFIIPPSCREISEGNLFYFMKILYSVEGQKLCENQNMDNKNRQRILFLSDIKSPL